MIFSPDSPDIALHEIGAPFDGHPALLDGTQNRRSDHISLTPEGKVPTLLIDNGPLTEVTAILY